MKKGFSVVFVAALCVSAIPASATSILGKPICKPGDPVVWENTSTKVYHLSGDKYYGNTKHGAYACRSAADTAGYHLAGAKGKAEPAGARSPAPMASDTPAAAHHRHHHKSGAAASPTPAPAAT